MLLNVSYSIEHLSRWREIHDSIETTSKFGGLASENVQLQE
jgi:hypothetical protein